MYGNEAKLIHINHLAPSTLIPDHAIMYQKLYVIENIYLSVTKTENNE
jgi:hypothetical protein